MVLITNASGPFGAVRTAWGCARWREKDAYSLAIWGIKIRGRGHSLIKTYKILRHPQVKNTSKSVFLLNRN